MDRKPQVMVFRPSMDEFKDFPRFVEHMEKVGAHKIGLAKVLSKSNCSCFMIFLFYKIIHVFIKLRIAYYVMLIQSAKF